MYRRLVGIKRLYFHHSPIRSAILSQNMMHRSHFCFCDAIMEKHWSLQRLNQLPHSLHVAKDDLQMICTVAIYGYFWTPGWLAVLLCTVQGVASQFDCMEGGISLRKIKESSHDIHLLHVCMNYPQSHTGKPTLYSKIRRQYQYKTSAGHAYTFKTPIIAHRFLASPERTLGNSNQWAKEWQAARNARAVCGDILRNNDFISIVWHMNHYLIQAFEFLQRVHRLLTLSTPFRHGYWTPYRPKWIDHS